MSISDREKTTISKFMSYILRHNPGNVGLKLDDGGWVAVDDLLPVLRRKCDAMSLEILEEVVATNNKQRFKISDDGMMIRASQGHSIEVDLGLEPLEPPAMLYHGTATRFMDSINEHGLLPQNRHHVHLSAELETARDVGSRHGKLVVLAVDAKAMHDDGTKFFRSDNGVWLADAVPPKYFTELN